MKRIIIAMILCIPSLAMAFGWGNQGSAPVSSVNGQTGAVNVTAGQVGAVASVVPDIVLPPKVYCVVGNECNLYLDNIIPNRSIDYNFTVTPSNLNYGVQQNERWTFVSPSAVGNTTITVELYRKDTDSALTSATTTLVQTAATTGNGITRKALFIGDSTTAAGIYTSYLLTQFSGSEPMRISLVGTKGSAGNLYEGTSGWSVSDYYTGLPQGNGSSPFCFGGTGNSCSGGGSFNFSTYLSTNAFSMAANDWVFIQLGINDVRSATNDSSTDALAATAVTRLEAMITNIHAYNSGIRIGISTAILPTTDQDGFATTSFNGDPKWLHKRKILRWNRAIVNSFSGRESIDNVFVVPLHVNLNTAKNMKYAATPLPVSAGSSTMTLRQDDGVHPDGNGYLQIKDSYYQILKSQEN